MRARDLPDSRTRRTASSRNCRAYGGRDFGTVDSSQGLRPSNDRVSTKPGQVQCAMSLAIIIANDRPDLTGFKYLYAKVSEEGQDPKMTGLVAEEERINIETHFSQMTPEDREAAKRFLEARPIRRFWYTGMYAGPTE